MVALGIAATVAVIIVMGILIAYRRQVKKICRQLAFLKEHQTNLRINAGLPFSELNELIDGINDTLDLSRKIQKESQQSENSLKETITNLSHDIHTVDFYGRLLSTARSERF